MKINFKKVALNLITILFVVFSMYLFDEKFIISAEFSESLAIVLSPMGLLIRMIVSINDESKKNGEYNNPYGEYEVRED